MNTKKRPTSLFSITSTITSKGNQGGKGFQMTFANGNTVSVQWGTSNYCDNRALSLDPLGNAKDCPRAEVAAWDSNEAWYTFPSDQVEGYLNADEVGAFIHFVMTTKISEAPPMSFKSERIDS